MPGPTPQEVLRFKQPTKSFLCPMRANSEYRLDFTAFKIRDLDRSLTLFEVERDADEVELTARKPINEDDKLRFIRYDFSKAFLDIKTIGTTLTFRVGPVEVPNLRMIERHYFKDRLIKSFDFTFGFCIPSSTNEWESIYTMPALDDATKQDMVNSPYETISDSFYFVDGQLVMHNKAAYRYL